MKLDGSCRAAGSAPDADANAAYNAFFSLHKLGDKGALVRFPAAGVSRQRGLAIGTNIDSIDDGASCSVLRWFE
jgi:hypothetical protein